MLKRCLLVVAAVAVLPFALAGGSSCTGGTGDPDYTCAASPPATSFHKVYTDVFTACTGCHLTTSVDGSNSYGLYDTEANALLQVNKESKFAGAEKVLKVVDPNKLDNSSMWIKVLGKPKSPSGKNVGSQMPQGGMLTAAQQQTLKDWICSGAKP